MLPKDIADERNAILEIRAGAGGDEAALSPPKCLMFTASTRPSAAGSLTWMFRKTALAASRKPARRSNRTGCLRPLQIRERAKTPVRLLRRSFEAANADAETSRQTPAAGRVEAVETSRLRRRKERLHRHQRPRRISMAFSFIGSFGQQHALALGALMRTNLLGVHAVSTSCAFQGRSRLIQSDFSAVFRRFSRFISHQVRSA